MIDQDRLGRFRREIARLVADLPADEFGRTVRAKLSDYLDRNGLPDVGASRLELIRQFEDLLGSDLAAFGRAIVDQYDEARTTVNDLYSDLGDVDITANAPRLVLVERAVRFDIGRYNEALAARIADAARAAMARRDDVRDLIRTFEQMGGQAATHARALGNTYVRRYARATKNERARVASVQFFEYVGAVRPTTRPFCLERVGKTYSITSILAMVNANLGPVIECCGGWNCAHDWEPDPLATEERIS